MPAAWKHEQARPLGGGAPVSFISWRELRCQTSPGPKLGHIDPDLAQPFGKLLGPPHLKENLTRREIIPLRIARGVSFATLNLDAHRTRGIALAAPLRALCGAIRDSNTIDH